MSTAYYVYCLDCEERHHFDNSDRELPLMRLLVLHAKAIFAAVPALRALREEDYSLAKHDGRLRVNEEWFAEHGEHRLVAQDEYGHNDDECGKWLRCGECGSGHQHCRLPPQHEGEHSHNRPDVGKTQ